jgi:branched-subunit amino acid aminotransferase/4-amino-4-deoxychorismate lyase
MAEVWLNGELRSAEAAGLNPNERGFLLGEAAFETMRWGEGAIRRWDRHRARLEGGLGFLSVPVPDLNGIEAAAAELAEALKVTDGVLRLTVGGGRDGVGLVRVSESPATVLLTLRPRPTPPAALRLTVLDGVRRGGLPSERFKLAGYADNIAARRLAAAQGADMAVMLGPDGHTPACADSANLFWVDAEDRVVTPPIEHGALPGTTRAALLEAAAKTGQGIEEASPERSSFQEAVAACVTNAVMGVVPVASVNDRPLATDHPMLQALIALERGAV